MMNPIPDSSAPAFSTKSMIPLAALPLARKSSIKRTRSPLDRKSLLTHTVEALEMAVRRIAAKEIKGLIHHSDRGVQYASADYIAILRHNGILPSMTEDGNPKDNAIAERVNGIIKNELLQGMRFSSIQEVRKAVATAVHFYNNERPHMSLDMLTPVQAGEMQGPIRKRWISYREKYLNVALA